MPAIPFTKRFRHQYPRFTRVLLLCICFFGSAAVGFGFASWAMVCRAGRCPPVEALQEYEPRQTSKVLARDGRFIAEIGLERRTVVRYADVPPLVRSAFVVTEDKRFFSHAGIDWWRVPGALLVDIKNRNFAEGFSTITMQLARNIFPERISYAILCFQKKKEAKVARPSKRIEREDSRALLQSDLPGQRRVRHRSRVSEVLWENAQGAQPGGDRDTRGASQRSGTLQSSKVSRSRRPAPEHRHRAHA